MTDYFIRVRMSWFLIQPACELISQKVSRMVVYEHAPEDNKDNIHVHMYLTDTQVSTDTLKNYIKKFTRVPAKGNEFWSFKTEYTPYGTFKPVPINDSCISYMSKGILEPVYVKGFTQDEIDTLKGQWDPSIMKTKAKPSKTMYVVKETHKEAKLRQNEMVDEIIKRLEQEDDLTAQNILKYIRQVVIIENKTICGRYKVRDYYDTVRAKILQPNTWVSEMMTFIAI